MIGWYNERFRLLSDIMAINVEKGGRGRSGGGGGGGRGGEGGSEKRNMGASKREEEPKDYGLKLTMQCQWYRFFAKRKDHSRDEWILLESDFPLFP